MWILIQIQGMTSRSPEVSLRKGSKNKLSPLASSVLVSFSPHPVTIEHPFAWTQTRGTCRWGHVLPSVLLALRRLVRSERAKKSKRFQILFLAERHHTIPSADFSILPFSWEQGWVTLSSHTKAILSTEMKWMMSSIQGEENKALVAPHGPTSYHSLQIFLVLELKAQLTPPSPIFISCRLWSSWWPTQRPSGVHHRTWSDHIQSGGSVPL